MEMGDVVAFAALIGDISQISIFVKRFFTPCCTTACVFPIDRQSPPNLRGAVPQIVDGQIAIRDSGSDQADCYHINMLAQKTGCFCTLEAPFWGQNGGSKRKVGFGVGPSRIP